MYFVGSQIACMKKMLSLSLLVTNYKSSCKDEILNCSNFVVLFLSFVVVLFPDESNRKVNTGRTLKMEIEKKTQK